MSDRKHRLFALALMLALCPHSTAEAAATEPDTCAAVAQQAPDNRLRNLAQALELASQGDEQRLKRATAVRKQVRDSDAPGDRLIDGYALLLQVASHISAGDYPQARALLRTVSLTHPRAVTAGLLMAESYRLEGDTDTAQDWFLRIADAFPHHPEAQQGLLSAALDAERAKQLPLARALLNRSATLAQQSADAAQALQRDSDRKKLDLLFQQPDALPDTIYRQFLRTLFQLRPETPALLEDIRDLKSRHGCIKARWLATQAQGRSMETLLANYAQQRSDIVAAVNARERRVAAMKQAVQPGDMSEAQIALRKDIRTQENLLRREQLALVAVDQNLRAAHAMTQAATKELAQLRTTFQAQWAERMDAMLSAIDVSVTTTQGKYRDIAGEAYVNAAEFGN